VKNFQFAPIGLGCRFWALSQSFCDHENKQSEIFTTAESPSKFSDRKTNNDEFEYVSHTYLISGTVFAFSETNDKHLKNDVSALL